MRRATGGGGGVSEGRVHLYQGDHIKAMCTLVIYMLPCTTNDTLYESPILGRTL